MKMKKKAKEALFIGLLCSVSYLAVYIARNVLSTVTPHMVESGAFTKEYIGDISSLFFIFYAIGQLANGFLGDKIKARYMMSLGLLLAGVVNFIFPYIVDISSAAKIIYGLTGLFLSMIYGPMTKVVAENTHPDYMTRCSLGYSLASYLGSHLAGVLAALLSWNSVFTVSSVALFIMALLCFICLLCLEKNGVVVHNRYKTRRFDGTKRSVRESIGILIRRRILLFSLVSVLTGVVRTTVVFWLPTYFSEYLGFSPRLSAVIFTVATLAISLTVFLAVLIYKLLRQKLYLTLLITFGASCLFFLLVYLVSLPIMNIIFIILAIMLANAAATMLWSMYCPSLRDTGVVSGATGFLVFIGYIASSASSKLFSNAVGVIGWENLILIWCALMAFGAVITAPFAEKK